MRYSFKDMKGHKGTGKEHDIKLAYTLNVLYLTHNLTLSSDYFNTDIFQAKSGIFHSISLISA